MQQQQLPKGSLSRQTQVSQNQKKNFHHSLSISMVTVQCLLSLSAIYCGPHHPPCLVESNVFSHNQSPRYFGMQTYLTLSLSSASQNTVLGTILQCIGNIKAITNKCSAVAEMGDHLATIDTHTHKPFYDPFSGTTRVSRCQKRTSGLYGATED